MTALMTRVAGMPCGYELPELKSLPLNSRFFPIASKLNIEDIQKPYNYLPKANEFYKEAKKTEITDKIEGNYNSHVQEIPRNRIVIERTNQHLYDRHKTWKKRVDILEETIQKYGDSFGAAELKYHIDLIQDTLLQYKPIKTGKVANSEYVKNHLTTLKQQLEEKHKIVSYNEASEYLEDRVDAFTTSKIRGPSLFKETAGATKSAYFKTLGAIVLVAWGVVSSMGWWSSAKDAKTYKNKAEGLETRFAGVLKEYDGFKNKVSQMETKINEIESKNSQLQLALDDLNTKYDEEKVAEQEKQAAEQKTPEIPTQVAERNSVDEIKNSNKKQKTSDYKITGNGGHFKGGWYKKLDDLSIPDEFDASEIAKKEQVHQNLAPLYGRAEYLSERMKKATHPKTFWQYITTPFRIGRTMFLGSTNLAATTIASIPVRNHPNAVEKVEDFTDALPGGKFNDELHDSIPTNPKKAIRLVKEHPGKAATALITDWGIGYKIERSNDEGGAETIVEEEFGGGEDGWPGLESPILEQIINLN